MRVEQWLGSENKLGIDIWKKKYKNGDETFDQWLHRVSGGDEEIKQLIVEKKFLYGGRILSNRGLFENGRKLTYSNCYVITPPKDNIESIFETASKLARTFSYGGGCGIDISQLSPKGAKINNAAKETTGSVSFMDLYNLVTGLIGQNGRRGALMLSIDCNHPDLEEFINVKTDLNKLTKANISVRVDDKFMNAVINDWTHKMTYYREETGEVITKEGNARDIFRRLCENNWNYAEPGLLFWDKIRTFNLLELDDEFEFAGVNPCAEEPLPAGGSCLLGSMNLAAFVKNGKFDYDDFEKSVAIAVRALNDVLDEGLALHPLFEQRKSVNDWRQIGLGMFGLADTLIRLGIEYGSNESLYFSDAVGKLMADTAIRTSALLAKQYGTYPKYKKFKLDDNDYYQHNTTEETRKLVEKYGLRNSQLLTVAPTGSLSTMLGVSGGIEPIFANYYTRKTESLHGKDIYYKVFTPIVEEYMVENDLKEVEDLPGYFVTATDIHPKDRINMQAIWQSHIDSSISSTVNLPESATVEDVEDLYLHAWESGLKGVTIFRDKCARVAILSTSEEKKEEEVVEECKDEITLDIFKPITRDQLGNRLNSATYVKQTACGKLYITISRDDNNNLVEIFIDPGKSGGCAANAESLGRMASTMMRAGVTIESIVDSVKGVKCAACIKGKSKKKIDGLSCGDIIARTIKEEYDMVKKDVKPVKYPIQLNKEVVPEFVENACPECGEALANEGGCNVCKNCGYSKCD